MSVRSLCSFFLYCSFLMKDYFISTFLCTRSILPFIFYLVNNIVQENSILSLCTLCYNDRLTIGLSLISRWAGRAAIHVAVREVTIAVAGWGTDNNRGTIL